MSTYTPGDIIDGRYHLRKMLGEGTFAEAWLAWEPTMTRWVVLKILRHNMTASELRRRFVEEARIMATLTASDHPFRDRVVKVYTVSAIDAPVLYMALEYVDGDDLQMQLYYEQPSLHEALCVWLAICEGVAVAHERELDDRPAPVIHRDLKPGNILLDKKRRPKVTDFGIARAEVAMTEGGARTMEFGTQRGTRTGTLGYAPPEQTSDASEADVRADLYSLSVIGAVLTADFDPGPTGQFLLYQQRVQRTALSALPEDVRTVIVKGCQADPDERFQTIRELIVAVQGLLEAHPDTGEPAWTPRPGRERPAATPTPSPGASPAPAYVAPSPGAAQGPNPLWTEVDDGSRRRRAVRIGIVVSALALVVGVVGLFLWYKPPTVPAAEAVDTETLAAEASTDLPIETAPDSLPIEDSSPIEDSPPPPAEVPTPPTIVETAPAIVKTEAPKPPPPTVVRREDPKPPPAEVKPPPPEPTVETPKATEPSISFVIRQENVNPNSSVEVIAFAKLPEGADILSATVYYRGSTGGGWQSKPVRVGVDGRIKTSLTVTDDLGDSVTYYIDIRLANPTGGKPVMVKSEYVTTVISR